MSEIIETANRRYQWNSNWAQIPVDITLGYTHGVVVDASGCVTIFNQSPHAVLRFESDGAFLGTWPEFPSERFLGAHGLTLVQRDGSELLWLTDQSTGEVALATLAGETLMQLDRPDHPTYRAGGKYSPTWATESPSDGTIYVADGYGSGLINRYDPRGKYLDSFDGSQALGRFACPHGIAFFQRPEATGTAEWTLYVTDRGNSRVQILDQQLHLRGSFYQDHPCCFAEGPGGELLVPDLYAFVNLYDKHDRPIVTRLGDHQMQVVKQHGWPNVLDEMRVPGHFNSPHGGAIDSHGNLYIVEWISDGRITKLTREHGYSRPC